MRMVFFLKCILAIAATQGGLAAAAITDPIPAKIPKGPVAVELKTIASGLVAPNGLLPSSPGGSQLFVTDQAGRVRVIQNEMLLPTPLVDVTSRLVSLSPNYDERGLLGLAFHPGFADAASPGFHKFYTYTSEPVRGPADFTVPMPPGVAFNHQSVILEWQASALDPAQVDAAVPAREIMRIDQPQSNHNGGMLAFGPDKLLYIALGDGGAANDVANGHTPGLGNGQDHTNVLGAILRIDVNGNTSANGRYAVPADNPFVGGGGVPEIFADGFRNPFRLAFDSATGDLIVADVGQNALEEIDRVTKGGNYGWNKKEGTFLFDPATGMVTADSPNLPAGLLDPVAQYDHDEGIAIIGGFVYHGTALPALVGKYVFGDFSRGFGAPDGRLFYADLATGAIRELQLGAVDRKLGLFVKGFGQDAAGELYLLASTALGPTGTTGSVMKLVPVPEPDTFVLLAIALACGAGGLAARRRENRRRGTSDHSHPASQTMTPCINTKGLLMLHRTLVCLVAAGAAAWAQPAAASFHLWRIDQVYSDPTGMVQYVDFVLPFTFDDERFLAGLQLTAGLGGHSLTFPSNLPSLPVAGQHFLVATSAFATVAGIAPDYTFPVAPFFNKAGDTVAFSFVDSFTFPALPTDGILALNRNLSTVSNKPINFANQMGSVPRPGDLNKDGQVNLVDVQVVGLNWMTAGPAGDANYDGIVNLVDVQVVGGNWTATPPVAAVPEPASILLALVAATMLLACRRCRTRRGSISCRVLYEHQFFSSAPA